MSLSLFNNRSSRRRRQAGICLLALIVAGLAFGLAMYHSVHNKTARTSSQPPNLQAETVEAPDNKTKTEADPALPPQSDTKLQKDSAEANQSTQKDNNHPSKAHPSSCRTDIADLVSDYKEKVKQQRELLNSRLEYPVSGSNITIRHIRTYNQSVAQIYARYVSLARNQGCTFPESPPKPMPENYDR